MRDLGYRRDLLPRKKGHFIYVHQEQIPPGSKLERGVSGPIPCDLGQKPAESSILRLTEREAQERNINLKAFRSYEEKPKVNRSLEEQRSHIDRNLTAATGRHSIKKSEQDCFNYIVEHIFRHCLCSMMRIVISYWSPSIPNRMIITSRDCDRLLGEDVPLVEISAQEQSLLWLPANKNLVPTSSTLVNWAFHTNFKQRGFLAHAHLIAPVIYDELFEGLSFIVGKPRTSSFGMELSRLLKSSDWVLRRQEGIWLFDPCEKNLIKKIIECQNLALNKLIDSETRS